MKSRIAISIAFVLLAAAAFAVDAAPTATQSDAQKSFDKIKSLAGTWEGAVTTVPKMEGMGDDTRMQVSLRVTSRGNALVHEMKGAGDGDDATKYDHPVTMFYLDNDRLLLTHYCDAGNRPRMAAKTSRTERRWNSTSSMWPAARSTDTWSMQCSLSSTTITTPRIRPADAWRQAMRGHMDLQRIK